jgi:WD40 repeat protein
VEDLSLKPFGTIRADHSDIILCAIMVNGKYIVTGSKDGLLNVYSIDGAKVSTLKGHQASICSLAIINDPIEGVLLASGSDHGCSSLVVWNTNTWSMRMKIQAHTAAVTSIVDLCDGQTIVSGSYDKKINIYSYRKDSLLYNLPNNKSSVTGIILNSSRNKMISCGLDNCLYVWSIVRRQDVKN